MAEDMLYRASVDLNGDIYEMVGLNKNRKLGIDIGRERELQQEIASWAEQLKERDEIIESWRPKMILHGYIEVPKTPEEIAQEAAAEQVRIAQAQADKQLKIAQENANKQNEFIQAQAQAMYQQTQAMTAMMSILARFDDKLGGVTNERTVENDKLVSPEREQRPSTAGKSKKESGANSKSNKPKS